MEEIFQNLNPYIGPQSFQREHNNIFFGRNEEAEKLLSMIFANQVVILYSQSGAGKTSLVNAKIEELLEREKILVYKVDLIGANIVDDVDPKNIFIYNTLLALKRNGTSTKEIEKMSLTNFLEKYYPLLSRKRFVFIFDQFEEMFTSHRDKWQDRSGFFEEIKMLCKNYRTLRFLFGIREDFLGYVDSHLINWDIKPFYFRLELLNETKALEAIKGPAFTKEYDEGVAEQIVGELLQTKIQDPDGNIKIVKGEFVEPVQLQLVCQKLWNSLRPEDKVIKKSHLIKIGGVERVIEDFYENAVKNAIENHPIREGKVRHWIEEELITSIKTRGSYLYGQTDKKGVPNEIVDSLLSSHLIRTEKRAGARWISLSHDRFVDPIIQSNQQWRLSAQQKKAKIFKNLFYGLLISVSFIIPILIIVFRLYFSQSISSHDEAFNNYLEGKQSFNEQNYEKAEDDLLNSLQVEETVEASLLLALTYKKIKENKKAIDQFNKTIQLAPKNADAYYELGNFLIENGAEKEGYQSFVRFFQIDGRSPRSVLPFHQYVGLIAYYFKMQISSADSTQRRSALNLTLELARQRVQYTYMGRSPETGFDCAGFITYILEKSNVLREGQLFHADKIRRFYQTTQPNPMDLIFFPGANNTVLFYLGDFFGEKLCIGIGLTAIVDIINIGDLNYAYSFHRINYR